MNTSDGARHHIYMLMQEEAVGVEGVGRSEKTAAQPAAAPTPKHLDVDCLIFTDRLELRETGANANPLSYMFSDSPRRAQ